MVEVSITTHCISASICSPGTSPRCNVIVGIGIIYLATTANILILLVILNLLVTWLDCRVITLIITRLLFILITLVGFIIILTLLLLITFIRILILLCLLVIGSRSLLRLICRRSERKLWITSSCKNKECNQS